MTGILLVDKPTGITSAAVVRRIKRRLPRRTKIGHVGTLDPFASGLLPLCVGEATKVARYLTDDRKVYEGTIALGVATDTLDPTGAVTDEAPVPALDVAELARVAKRFTGAIEQEPPMFSAIKREGVPLYRLARAGQDVERPSREVEIAALELRPGAPGRVELRVECSKGTYVRVLAADVGRALGTVAHLARLRRLAVGGLEIDAAVPLERLEALEPGSALPMLPIGQALPQMRRERVTAEELARLRQGQQGLLERLEQARPGAALLLVTGDPEMVCGVAEADQEGRWRLARLLNREPDTSPLHA